MGKTKDYTDEQERIARYAKAMGHPARMAILQFLAGRETCFFGDIHKELKEAGLIQGEIEAPKVKYCINRTNWEEAKRLFSVFFCHCKDKKSCC